MVTAAEASDDVLVTVRHLLDRAFDNFDDDDWDHALGGCHAMVTDDADATVVAHGSVVPRELHVAGRTGQGRSRTVASVR